MGLLLNQTQMDKKAKKNKDVFDKKEKVSKASKPKPKPASKEEEEPLFEATKGKIKEGGLRKALKVDKSYKFRKPALNKLLKHQVGDKFEFEGNSFRMTEKLRKQVQLALNMES